MTRALESPSRKRRQLRAEWLEDRRLLAGDTYTIVQMPDTQTLTEFSPETFNAQTQWVADHVQSNNIVFLSHVGDVVENPSVASEWQAADAAMSILDGDPAANPDGLVPYGVATGNHDYDSINSHSAATEFTNYFGESRYQGKSWYGGASADGLNHFQLFSADGQQFLHLTLEWEPRDSAIDWAQGILDAYADVPTIVTTHSYLDKTGGHATQQVTSDGHSGLDVFQSLVSPNPQVFMVLGGHFAAERHQVSLNSAGSEVIEVLANFQGRSIGEDGYLRLIEFEPSADVIHFTTYSPSLDQFETDSGSQFSLDLDFQQRFDLAAVPRARLAQPADNGSSDLNPAADTVTVNTPLASLDISLLDFSSGIDDATVSNATLALRKDGLLLNETADYTFSYNSNTDQISIRPASGLWTDGNYQISLNSGTAKIADQDGFELSTVAYAVEVATSIPDAPESLYFALNTAATLEGGLTVEPADIVFFDGDQFSQFFDGSDVGIGGFEIDALGWISEFEILLSFTSSGNIPGITDIVDDSDIVKFTATSFGSTTDGMFELFFDGSDVGLSSSGEDVDGLDVLADGRLVLSTRSTFDVGTVAGGDEDLLVFMPTALGSTTAGTWELYFDGSDVGLGGEDVNGISVYPNGDLYVSTAGSFTASAGTIRDDDVFVFQPATLGDDTTGSIASELFLDGSLVGLSSYDVMALHVPRPVHGNRAPDAVDDFVVLEVGGTATQLQNGSLSLLANDTDADLPGDALTVNTTPVSGPSSGSLVLNADGTFTYTHNGSATGTDSFVYEITDAEGASDTASVTISIVAANTAPTTGNSQVTASEDTVFSFVLEDFPFFDVDGDRMPQLQITSLQTAGSLRLGGSDVTLNQVITALDIDAGHLQYLPAANANGVDHDSFAFKVQDGLEYSADEAVMTIDVTAVNDAPVLTGLPDISFVEGAADSSIHLGSFYTDVETPAGSATFSILSSFAGVSASIDPVSKVLMVTGDFGFSGSGEITIQVVDAGDGGSAALSDTDTIHVTVSPDSGDTVLLLGLDRTTTVGDVVAQNEDVLVFYGGQFSMLFDGSDVGLADAKLDAFALLSPTELLLSFTAPLTLAGIVDTVDDSDIVKFTGTQFGDTTQGSFELYLDGSDVGLAGSAHDIDALEVLPNGKLLISITGSDGVGPLTVRDDDLIVFTPTSLGENTTGTWEFYFDGSDVGLSPEDLHGVAVDAAGDLYLNVQNDFVAGAVAGDDEDVFVFMPTSLGGTTNGSYSSTLFFDGSRFGLSAAELTGIDLTTVGSLPSFTNTAAFASVPQSFQTFQQASLDSAEDINDDDTTRTESQSPQAGAQRSQGESQAMSADNVDQVMAQLPGGMTAQQRSEAWGMDRLRLLSAANEWE